MSDPVEDRAAAPIEIQILMAEDNPADVRLTRETLKEAGVPNTFRAVGDGSEALAFLRREGVYGAAPRPNLVLLDLNLPKMSGHEVLAEMKNDPELRRIPVVVLSGSDADRDVSEVYDRHANSFVVKPISTEDFVRVLKSIEDFWLVAAKLPP